MNSFKNTDTILIIGGTGFIGRHLTSRCLMETPFVTCVGLLKGSYNGEPFLQDVEVIKTDISDKEQLHSVLHGRNFDYVFNLGGYIDHTYYSGGGRKAIECHFIGLLNLIDCVNTKGLKGFVQIGSSDEYGNSSAPQKEIMRERPISPYSLAKVAASHFIQMLYITEEFPGTVLRLFLVYGPMQDDKRFLPHIIKGCLKGESFNTSEGKQIRDFCYIADVVDAMVRAAVLPSAKGQIINVASGMPISIREMIETVIKLIGKGNPVWDAHPYRVGENMELYADISLAKSLLKWEPKTSLKEGLRKTIDYYRSFITD